MSGKTAKLRKKLSEKSKVLYLGEAKYILEDPTDPLYYGIAITQDKDYVYMILHDNKEQKDWIYLSLPSLASYRDTFKAITELEKITENLNIGDKVEITDVVPDREGQCDYFGIYKGDIGTVTHFGRYPHVVVEGRDIRSCHAPAVSLVSSEVQYVKILKSGKKIPVKKEGNKSTFDIGSTYTLKYVYNDDLWKIGCKWLDNRQVKVVAKLLFSIVENFDPKQYFERHQQ